MTAVLTALPFMGVGSFKYGGEGFCYFDWYSKPLMVITFVVSSCSLIAVPILFGLAARALNQDKILMLM